MNNIPEVSERSNPELKWEASPPFVSMPNEFYQSYAFGVLTKSEIVVLMWVLACRRYPSKRQRKGGKAKFNIWKFVNKNSVPLSYKAFCSFNSQQQRSKRKPISEKTFRRALTRLMEVGFIALVRLGGRGIGDVSYYRYSYNWLVWREGDKPCFTRKGHSRIGMLRPQDSSGRFVKE